MSRFKIGDRVTIRYLFSLGRGTILGVEKRAIGYRYEITWDDGSRSFTSEAALEPVSVLDLIAEKLND